jgi:hypothetical protein
MEGNKNLKTHADSVFCKDSFSPIIFTGITPIVYVTRSDKVKSLFGGYKTRSVIGCIGRVFLFPNLLPPHRFAGKPLITQQLPSFQQPRGWPF